MGVPSGNLPPAMGPKETWRGAAPLAQSPPPGEKGRPSGFGGTGRRRGVNATGSETPPWMASCLSADFCFLFYCWYYKGY